MTVNNSIRQFQAVDWLSSGSDATNALSATSIGKLLITGDKKNAIAGNFAADLNLGSVMPNQSVLNNATIAGDILGGSWSFKEKVPSSPLTAAAIDSEWPAQVGEIGKLDA